LKKASAAGNGVVIYYKNKIGVSLLDPTSFVKKRFWNDRLAVSGGL